MLWASAVGERFCPQLKPTYQIMRLTTQRSLCTLRDKGQAAVEATHRLSAAG